METTKSVEIVNAGMMAADLHAFIVLEREFAEHYDLLGVGKQYGLIPFPGIPPNEHLVKYLSYFEDGENGFFVFAKAEGKYLGYLAGHIEEMPPGYQVKRIGFLDSVIVNEGCRGLGIGQLLRDHFYAWLQSKQIDFCQLTVKVENNRVNELYKKWGFKTDEYRMSKPLTKDLGGEEC